MKVINRRVGLRYMTRFACIGSACEDTCCAGWAVPVDAQRLHALGERMSRTPAERAEFEAAFAPPPPGMEASHRAADMMMDETGACAMLGADRLCAIQKRYGEDLIPNTCAIFPRSIGRINDRAELVATLSCPEIARLCLLADDAVDLVPIEEARFTRGLYNKQIDTPEAEPYEQRFEPVRAAMLELLARPYPIASRLMFLACLAHRTAGYFRNGYHVKDEHLDGVLAQLAEPATLDALHAQFVEVDAADPFALSVVMQVLLARQFPLPNAFTRLVDRVLGSYPWLDPGVPIDGPRLWAAYRERRDSLPAWAQARLERYFTNYCINQLVKDWFIGWPSFVGYAQSLFVQVAVIRFLLLGHPGTAEAVAAEREDEGRTRLDAAAVEAFQGFARGVQHDSALTYRIVDSLEKQQMQTLAHSINLLRF